MVERMTEGRFLQIQFTVNEILAEPPYDNDENAIGTMLGEACAEIRCCWAEIEKLQEENDILAKKLHCEEDWAGRFEARNQHLAAKIESLKTRLRAATGGEEGEEDERDN